MLTHNTHRQHTSCQRSPLQPPGYLGTLISAPPMRARPHGEVQPGCTVPLPLHTSVAYTHTHTHACSVVLDLSPHQPISLMVTFVRCRTEHYHTYGELEFTVNNPFFNNPCRAEAGWAYDV